MEIKKVSDDQISVNYPDNSAIIKFNGDGTMSVTVDGGNDIIIDRPGEYEHGGLTVMAQEFKSEGEQFTSSINMLTVSSKNNVMVLALDSSVELSKEVIDFAESVNVIVLHACEKDYVASLLKKFSPEYFLLVNNKNITPEKLEEFKKLHDAKDGEKKIKFDLQLFNSEEDVPTNIVILG
jgi:hypothetical protein